ncbi:MAG: DNA-binding protein [Acidobacteria bacterium]|nr:DNA-binding protein [Acidobacteriota bacterium]
MKDDQSVLSDYLTKAELAQQLGRSERTLDRWAVLRTGPPRTRAGGRKILYNRGRVEQWLERQTEQPPGMKEEQNPVGRRRLRSRVTGGQYS